MIPELKLAIDNDQIGLTTAMKLSQMSEAEQQILLPDALKACAILDRIHGHRNIKQYRSDRLIPLLWWGPPPSVPTLTMECYEKWYDSWLVKPDGSVEKIDWTVLETVARWDQTAWRDHAPNPDVVERLCEQMGWHFHHIAKEIMYARFQGEI